MPDEDDHLLREVARILRDWPQVYGRTPCHSALAARGFECRPGWYPLIERLTAQLAEVIAEDRLDRFYVTQVKEKFGGLRVYVQNGNARCQALIEEATREAAQTCEGCGRRPVKIRTHGGWLITCCDDCLVTMAPERRDPRGSDAND